jgi:chromosome segregation ATPase
MVLEQKKLRIENQLQSHVKEIKELDKTKEDLRKDMVKMNSAVAKNDAKTKELSNANSMMESEFVQKLKEIEAACLDTEQSVERVKDDKAQMSQDILEAERQVLLWERKITLEKEMQEALDPNIGQAGTAAMRKEIHRMELRLDQLKRRQEQMILEMQRTISKRDVIASKYEPKAKNSKQAQSSQTLKRQVQSLKNNLRLCTQANSDTEQKIAQKETELAQLQQAIEQNQEECSQLERAVEGRRTEVQVSTVTKQRNLASILRLQRAKMRYEELAMGTGPQPPTRDMRGVYQEQLMSKNKIINVVKVLHDACPQLESLWDEFYTWLDVPRA